MDAKFPASFPSFAVAMVAAPARPVSAASSAVLAAALVSAVYGGLGSFEAYGASFFLESSAEGGPNYPRRLVLLLLAWLVLVQGFVGGWLALVVVRSYKGFSLSAPCAQRRYLKRTKRTEGGFRVMTSPKKASTRK